MGDVTAIFLQYGAIGAIALVLGWFAWQTIKRERERSDKLENMFTQIVEGRDAKIAALQDRLAATERENGAKYAIVIEKTVPPLQMISQQFGDLVKLVQEQEREITVLKAVNERRSPREP